VKIKIVGINYFPELTGIAPYTTGMAEGLAAYGHDVNVVTGLPHYPEWRIYDAYRSRRSYREIVNGVTIDRLRHYVPRNPSPRNRIRMEASFARAALGVENMAVRSKLTTYFTTGKPVVAATDQSSAAAGELQAAGAGVIAAPADPRTLLDAALTIGRNKTAAKHFGEAGKRYSREMFDRGSVIRRYEIWCNEPAASSSEMVCRS
jgi:glycosyltransferase involved in cell wall biosynthesis